MAVPGDATEVLTAIRLGWCMSEVRGRNRPGWEPGATGPVAPTALAAPVSAAPPGAPDTYEWGVSPLPLENELDLAQLREEAQNLLGKLASDLNVNDPGGYSARVERQAEALATAQPGDVTQQWETLAKLIHDFDWNVQSILALKSTTVACGYQLGRALADPYWALEPALDDAANHASWSFLLGSKRCSETQLLLGRLTAYFHPYTAAAIAGSLQVWKSVGASPDWQREPNAYPLLYQQIRRWYELVVLDQDPTTLIQPYHLLKNYRLVWRTLRAFWFQLLLAALAAAAVGFFAYLLTKPHFNSGLKALLATIGLAGFSVAGLAAKVKNEAQAMLIRLKQDTYTDLITESITSAPLPPKSLMVPKAGLLRPLTRQGKMTRIMQSRTLTPVTPS